MPIPSARVAAASEAPRFRASLLAAAAAVALLLAGVGIYGVLALLVGERTREIGFRMALGAAPRRVLGNVLVEGVVLAGVGVLLGVAGAMAITRVLANLLYDTTPTDVVTYASIAALAFAMALVASWLPARRATRIDPTLAIRRA